MGYNANDYVQVNERIEKFRAEWPEGSLQSEVIELTDTRVTVKGLAYRHPQDPRPGIGHSFLNIPGSTNFTKGSELENAETSAWGRALAALGYEVKKSIASAEEVQSKTADTATASRAVEGAASSRGGDKVGLSDKQRGMLMARFKEVGIEGNQRVAFTTDVVGKFSTKQMTSADLDKVLEALKDESAVKRAQEVKPE